MTLSLIVMALLIVTLIGAAVSIKIVSRPPAPSHNQTNDLEAAIAAHPAGKGLKAEEDILNDR